MAQAYQELLAKKQEIEAAIEASKIEWKTAKIAEVKHLMQQAGLTLEDIGGKAKPVRTKPRAKYSDGVNSWSGRGLTPKWLRGKNRDDFLIKTS